MGGASYDKHKTPITDEVMGKALEADAILFGAVGGPDYDGIPFELKPERALLKLRKELGLFANLRPAIVFDSLYIPLHIRVLNESSPNSSISFWLL